MNPEILPLVARIKIRLRKEKEVILNTQRFFSEQEYAKQILDMAEDCEDVEIVTAALELRGLMGWIAPVSTATSAHNTTKTATAAPGSASNSRYMFGARS